MATKQGSYREEAIKFHNSWFIEKDITKIRQLLYPKIDKLDMEKVREFRKYLEKL